MSDRDAADDRNGAVVDVRFGGQAPVHIIVVERAISRFLTVVTGAGALGAALLAAAIVVRNDVVLAVGWIAASADPGDL